MHSKAPGATVSIHPAYALQSTRSLAASVTSLVNPAATCRSVISDLHETETSITYALGELNEAAAGSCAGCHVIEDAKERKASLARLAVTTNRAQAAVLSRLATRIDPVFFPEQTYETVVELAGKTSAATAELVAEMNHLSATYEALVRHFVQLPAAMGQADVNPVAIDRPFDLALMLKNLVKDLSTEFPDCTDGFSLHGCDAPIIVFSDAYWVRTILENFIRGLSYLPYDGPSVCLTLASAAEDTVRLEIEAFVEGFSPIDVARLTPFFGKPDPLFAIVGGSKRLGTNIAREILAVNGGNITFPHAQVETTRAYVDFAGAS